MELNKSDLDGLFGVDLARFWADTGGRVLPVAPAPAKRPLIGAWQEKATDDRQQVEAWWRQSPEARVGIATGTPGYDVLDFDVAGGKPGIEQMTKLVDAGVIEPGTFWLVGTPSGGRHAYFEGSTQRNKQNEKAIPGVDFRGAGGMVLAAGNPGYTILASPLNGLATVSWERVRAALAPPTPLASPPANQSGPAGTDAPPARPAAPVASQGYKSALLVDPVRAFDDPAGEESPLDWFTRTHDMDQLLLDAGWRFMYEQGGRRHWCRPGKDANEVSGNTSTMPDGRIVFYNFSSSVDLPVNTALSVAQLYAHLHHGGSQRDAASAIRRTMMPQRQAPTTAPAGPPVNSRALAGTYAPPPPPVLGTSHGDGEPVGRELVPIDDAFWTERVELRNIRWLARERRVSPWSALGSVLALVSCRIGPHVVLPPIVGGAASLNLLVGLVGPSGKGKGASWDVAMEYLGYGDHSAPFSVEEISTPEGIDASFTETPPKSGPVQFNDVAFFYVPEVDRLKSQAENYALLSHLRKVYSGELLGGKTAAKERWRPVRRHAYRASAAVGIQPRRSGVILGDADGGLPQRFLWMPVHDPGAIRRTDRFQPPGYSGQPPAIDYDVWVPQGEQRGDKGEPLPVDIRTRWEIPVCRTAQNEVIDAREENVVSERAGLDSHALLTQLKVAALLAFLDQRAEVTEADWRLSRVVMKVSDQTRDWCSRELRDAEDEEDAKKGRSRAVARVHEDLSHAVVRDERLDRIVELGDKLLAVVQSEAGREWSPKQLRELLGDKKTRDRYWEDVHAALIATPGVTQGPEVTSGGRKIRKVSWTGS